MGDERVQTSLNLISYHQIFTNLMSAQHQSLFSRNRIYSVQEPPLSPAPLPIAFPNISSISQHFFCFRLGLDFRKTKRMNENKLIFHFTTMIVIRTHSNQTPTTHPVPTLHEPETAQLMLWYAHLRSSFYSAFVFVLRLSFTLLKRTKTNGKKVSTYFIL